MKKLSLLLLFLIVPLVSASVSDEIWAQVRLQHYQPNGYVIRESGDSTSETLSYAAFLECSVGDLGYCKSILQWADTNAWTGKSFAWMITSSGGHPRGNDGATDGDLLLLWAAAKAYDRTGEQVYLTLFKKWSVALRQSDTCGDILASGSGIGNWNGCYSFNGVYSAYIILPALFDIQQLDKNWTAVYVTGTKEMYDMFTMHGGKLPPRCAAYDGTKIDVKKCEILPSMDYFDAQRAIFWAGIMCKRSNEDNIPGSKLSQVCQQVTAVTKDDITSDYKTAIGGYSLNGTGIGKYQFNEFGAALWLPAVEYTRGEGNKVVTALEGQWNGKDFWGTLCTGKVPCVDMYKDTLVLMSMIEQKQDIWIHGSVGVPVTQPAPQPIIQPIVIVNTTLPVLVVQPVVVPPVQPPVVAPAPEEVLPLDDTIVIHYIVFAMPLQLQLQELQRQIALLQEDLSPKRVT